MPFEWLMQLFWGFFIGGVVVTAIMMVLLGMSISGGSGSDTSDHDAAGHDTGDHDAGHDTGDHDAGHDTGDHDAGNDGGHEGSGDQGLDSHIAVNLNVEAGIDSPDAVLYTSDKGQKAPLLLLVAGYLMFSGALGLSFSALIDVNIFIVLGIAFVPPFLLDKLLGLVWRKITKSETYIIPVETPLIGRKAIVFMKVNIDGGVVRIDATGSPIGSQRIPVMPLYSDKTFDAGKEVYICDYAPVQGKKFYLVDDDPSEVRKVRHVNV